MATDTLSLLLLLLQILDVNVQTDAHRKQNSYLTGTFAKVIELLDNAGPGKFTYNVIFQNFLQLPR